MTGDPGEPASERALLSTRNPSAPLRRVYDAEAPRPGPAAEAVSAVRSIVDARDLLVELIRRDLAVRYKQTLMGVAWAFLVPLAGMLVFTVVFNRAVRVDTPVPYPLFAYAGLLLWTMVASSLRAATTSLTQNHALVTKVPFPRAVLPLSAVAVSFVDFLVGLLLLGGILAYYAVSPTATIALLPVVVLITLTFAAGLGLLLAMANLFYRDVAFVLGLGLTLWMFLSSVVYPVSLVGGHLGRLLALNPLNPLLDAFRASLFGDPIDGVALGATAGVSVAALAFALALFRRLEPRFAEAI